jgi:methylmalonyl-CoA mutase cobalamin-binding domain/chain
MTNTATKKFPIRVVLAKVGLDGHDRGVQVVGRALRDSGMEVIYTGLWQSPEAVVRAVVDEDADVLGVSLLSGAHLTLMPRLIELLEQAGRGDVVVVVGGIVPDSDRQPLLEMGVHLVFGPGTSLAEMISAIKHEVTLRRPHPSNQSPTGGTP